MIKLYTKRFGGGYEFAEPFLISGVKPQNLGDLIMASGLKLPSTNQLLTLAIALAVLTFVLRFLPENVKGLFRI